MLNKEQLQAVEYFSSPLRIIAGAGSGKTRVLTTKVIKAINDGVAKEWEIMAVTFTNKATKEMKHRIAKNIGHEPKCLISTFHSLCYKILRQDIDKIGYKKTFTTLDSIDKKNILKKIIKSKQHLEEIKPNIASSIISKWKRDRLMPSEVDHDELDIKTIYLIEIYNEYNNKVNKMGSLDFDDLILKTEVLFDKSPDVANKWANKFKLVLIDEFQDTDEIQYEIIKKIAKYSQLIVVGDPDQTIYSWRGAKSFIFTRQMEKDFDNLMTITLNQNYRSVQPVLNVANQLISNNKDRLKKELFSERKSNVKPYYFHATTSDEEAMWVVHSINDLKKRGTKNKEIAILYRASFLSRGFEKQLASKQIPYKRFGGLRFTERAEIKDALAYLRSAVQNDDVAFERIINTPKRKIGPTTLNKIENFAQKNNSNLMDATFSSNLKISPSIDKERAKLKDLFLNINHLWSTKELLKYLLTKSGYLNSLSGWENESRIENLKELDKWIDQYEKEHQSHSTLDFLNEALLQSSQDNDSLDDAITLMTIHTSKGLEYKYVFIVGVCEWIFPSPRALEESLKNLEEERRLFYVAATRAEDCLFVSSFGGRTFSGQYSLPSRFIEEAGVQNFQSAASTKTELKTRANLNEGSIWFNDGDIVHHAVFGEGVVLSCGNVIVQIAFKRPHGVKSLNKKHKALSLVK